MTSLHFHAKPEPVKTKLQTMLLDLPVISTEKGTAGLIYFVVE